jgi:hypothetical protein
MARDVLLGQMNISKLKQQINLRYHDFLDECRRPILLKKITEADIEKFLTVKPDPSIPEIKSKLPEYLYNLIKAFFSPRREKIGTQAAMGLQNRTPARKRPPISENQTHIFRKT